MVPAPGGAVGRVGEQAVGVRVVACESEFAACQPRFVVPEWWPGGEGLLDVSGCFVEAVGRAQDKRESGVGPACEQRQVLAGAQRAAEGVLGGRHVAVGLVGDTEGP